jgi:hypothetical protein
MHAVLRSNNVLAHDTARWVLLRAIIVDVDVAKSASYVAKLGLMYLCHIAWTTSARRLLIEYNLNFAYCLCPYWRLR